MKQHETGIESVPIISGTPFFSTTKRASSSTPLFNFCNPKAPKNKNKNKTTTSEKHFHLLLKANHLVLFFSYFKKRNNSNQQVEKEANHVGVEEQVSVRGGGTIWVLGKL